MGVYYSKTPYSASYSGSAIQTLPFYKTALEGAGWVIDRYDVGSRLHAHFGDEHIEIVSNDTAKLQGCYCTGYDSGAAWSAQPGTSPAIVWYSRIYAATDYLQIHVCDNRILVGLRYNNGALYGGLFFGKITNKVGSWNGGRLFTGNNTTSAQVLGATIPISCLELEGAWITNSVYGTYNNTPLIYRPLVHTGAIFLTPILMCKNNDVTASLKHPLGYIDGIYNATPHDYYLDEETVLIDGVLYRWICPGWWYLCREG